MVLAFGSYCLLPADLVIRVPTAVKKTASIDGFYWQEPEMLLARGGSCGD